MAPSPRCRSSVPPPPRPGSLVAGLPDLLRAHLHYGAVASFRPLFYIAAASGLALTVLILPIREQRREAARAAGSRLTRASLGLILRLALTNGLTGLAFGILGPFLTYWLSVRYGVSSSVLAGLFTIVNLATIVSYVASPAVARWLGSVRSVVLTRVGSVLLLAAMVLAPTFGWACVAYVVRMLFSAMGQPIRQSFVMGVSEAQDRSRIAALGNVPSQVTSLISPTLGAYLLQDVSFEAPLWLATAVLAINAVVYGLAFRRLTPPEERAPIPPAIYVPAEPLAETAR